MVATSNLNIGQIGNGQQYADIVDEYTDGAGVTVDGLLIKDGKSWTSGVSSQITQNNTTLGAYTVGTVLYLDTSSGLFKKAIASAEVTAIPAGIVRVIYNANLPTFSFDLTLCGKVEGMTGLTTGARYYVSPTTAGALTSSRPAGFNWPVLAGTAISTTEFMVDIQPLFSYYAP